MRPLKHGEARWIFRPAQQYRATTYRPPPRGTQVGPRAAVRRQDRRQARRAADRFRQGHAADRYLLPGESYQDLFARVATAYADDADHAQRLYDYISQAVVHAGDAGAVERRHRPRPADLLLPELGRDSLDGIVGTWNENVWLASRGGGIGTYWGSVRGIGEPVGLNGKTSGIIPFIRVMDSLTLAISQGSLRRGSAAVYLDISPPGDRGVPRDPQTLGRLQPQGAEPAPRHARSPTSSWKRCATAPSSACAVAQGPVGARQGRRPLAVPEAGRDPPRDRRALHHLLRHGEPGDAASISATSGLKVSTSNLCSEITLPTGSDHLGNDRTAVCCLSSLNLETWDEWNDDKQLHRGRDALPRQRAAGLSSTARPAEMARAKYSRRARALGRPGRDGLPLLPAGARACRSKARWPSRWNLRMFKHIARAGRRGLDACSPTSAAPAPTPPTWA